MMNYKIIESSIGYLKGIELPYDFSSFYVGQQIDILGNSMKITQLGDEVVGCSNTDNILVFQKIS